MLGLTHFLFFERKVIFLETGNQFLGTERIGRGVLTGAVRAVPLGDYHRENLSGIEHGRSAEPIRLSIGTVYFGSNAGR